MFEVHIAGVCVHKFRGRYNAVAFARNEVVLGCDPNRIDVVSPDNASVEWDY